jgi:hypothetical protein
MIHWYFSMIIFMQTHFNPYKIVIKRPNLHYEGIGIILAPKP